MKTTRRSFFKFLLALPFVPTMFAKKCEPLIGEVGTYKGMRFIESSGAIRPGTIANLPDAHCWIAHPGDYSDVLASDIGLIESKESQLTKNRGMNRVLEKMGGGNLK